MMRANRRSEARRGIHKSVGGGRPGEGPAVAFLSAAVGAARDDRLLGPRCGTLFRRSRESPARSR